MAARRVEIPEHVFVLMMPEGPWRALSVWRHGGFCGHVPRAYVEWLREVFRCEGIDPAGAHFEENRRRRVVILEGPALTSPAEPVA